MAPKRVIAVARAVRRRISRRQSSSHVFLRAVGSSAPHAEHGWGFRRRAAARPAASIARSLTSGWKSTSLARERSSSRCSEDNCFV